VVEESPAPPHPWSESAAISREPTRGSPYLDEIDELVSVAVARGPRKPLPEKCGYCKSDWHGFPNGLACQGSHLKQYRKKKKP